MAAETEIRRIVQRAAERGLPSLIIGGACCHFARLHPKHERPRLLVPEGKRSEWLDLFAGERVLVPRPEHLVALKIHAAKSLGRSKPAVDWEDIRQIIRLCALDPEDDSFRQVILRYGGEDALERIKGFIRQ